METSQGSLPGPGVAPLSCFNLGLAREVFVKMMSRPQVAELLHVRDVNCNGRRLELASSARATIIAHAKSTGLLKLSTNGYQAKQTRRRRTLEREEHPAFKTYVVGAQPERRRPATLLS